MFPEGRIKKILFLFLVCPMFKAPELRGDFRVRLPFLGTEKTAKSPHVTLRSLTSVLGVCTLCPCYPTKLVVDYALDLPACVYRSSVAPVTSYEQVALCL